MLKFYHCIVNNITMETNVNHFAMEIHVQPRNVMREKVNLTQHN